jgi:hypothetical protein
VQLERRKEAERVGAVPEEDPRTLPDDRGNYAIMHAIARGNNSMAALLDACVPPTLLCAALSHHACVACALPCCLSRRMHECDGLVPGTPGCAESCCTACCCTACCQHHCYILSIAESSMTAPTNLQHSGTFQTSLPQ